MNAEDPRDPPDADASKRRAPPLDPAQRRALRAQAHHLHPVVAIGHHGLTPPVLHEIDVALTAHGLIKVRVLGDDRDAREAICAEICAQVGCAPVQHLGKLLILWRPVEEAVGGTSARPGRTAGKAAKKPGAKSAPRRRIDKKPTAAKPKAGSGSRRRNASGSPATPPRATVPRHARGQPPAEPGGRARPPRSGKAPAGAANARVAPGGGKGRGPATGPLAGAASSSRGAPPGPGRRAAGPSGVPRAPNPRRRRSLP